MNLTKASAGLNTPNLLPICEIFTDNQSTNLVFSKFRGFSFQRWGYGSCLSVIFGFLLGGGDG